MTPLPLRFVLRAVTLAAALAAVSASAANIYPVRHGSFENLFGKEAAKIAASFAGLTEKQSQTFDGPAGLKGAVIYFDDGFMVLVFRTGATRVENAGDVGGRLVVQLHDGMKNNAATYAPICFSYDFSQRTPPPKAKPRGEPTGVEEDDARALKPRVQPLVPVYRNTFTRTVLPSASFSPLPDGWYAAFSFRWHSFYGRIPFEAGKYPVSWRLVAEYTAPDGAVSTWGTLDDPVVLSWARGGDARVTDIQNSIFLSDATGPKYKEYAEYLDTRWSTYKTEQYIGYFDPGKPTFETKNPASDDLFYRFRLKPLVDRNKNLEGALYFNFRDGIPKPKVMMMEKSYRDEIFSQLGRLYFVMDDANALRRDYLLARFTDRPVLPAAPDTRKAKPKAKKPAPGGDDLFDAPDTVGEGIDLDDIAF